MYIFEKNNNNIFNLNNNSIFEITNTHVSLWSAVVGLSSFQLHPSSQCFRWSENGFGNIWKYIWKYSWKYMKIHLKIYLASVLSTIWEAGMKYMFGENILFFSVFVKKTVKIYKFIGCFFSLVPPEKLKYGKPMLGESTST